MKNPIGKLVFSVSIQKKLWFGYLFILLLFALSSLNTLWNLSGTQSSMNQVVLEIQPVALKAQQIARELEHTTGSMGFYLLSKDEYHKIDYTDGLSSVAEQINELKDDSYIQSRPDVAQQIDNISTSLKQLSSYQEQLLKLAVDDSSNYPALRYAGQNIHFLSKISNC